MTIADQIEAVRQSLSAVKAAGPGSRLREVRVRKCLALAAALHGERDHLVSYLDKGDAWFRSHEEQRYSLSFIAKEDRWLAALKDYEAASDLLSDVLRTCCASTATAKVA